MKNRIIRAFSVGCIGVLLFSYVANQPQETVASTTTATTAGIVSVATVDVMSTLAAVEDSAVVATGSANTYGYTNLGISKAEGNVNIRESADTNSSIVGKLPENAGCEIVSVEGDWSYITSGEVEGYVLSEYLLTGDEAIARAAEVVEYSAYVEGDSLRVRLEPNTTSEILSTVSKGTELEIVSELDGWVEVNIDGTFGYVSADYVTCSYGLRDALTLTEARFGEGVSDVRAALVTYALQFVGNPYVWGGTSLTRGADCSGFVLSIFANYGISLPHSSRAQANYGTRVSTSELQPGDLLFYGSGSYISHVAIYIGGGQIVHASTERTGIIVSNAFNRTPICCVSLLD